MVVEGRTEFLSGVIEGFYGPPWSQEERLELFQLMAGWGLNTYLYAPKDDLKHRAIWREPYIASEEDRFRTLITACERSNIHFIYALSPGLDIRYNQPEDLQLLQDKFDQMIQLGCRDFAILFDDIPDRRDPEELKRWGSTASAQCHVANELFLWTRSRSGTGRFLFCPTAYCGRMAERGLGGADYLSTLGMELNAEIEILWTGPEIISHEITANHIAELQLILKRRPVIWDNLHANDYDGRRFFCGPYAGRSPELRELTGGLLLNPNTEFPLNFVPVRTLAKFVRGEAPWDPRNAYISAMEEWLRRFETISLGVSLEDLVLFGDCYYLPHEEGPEAEKLIEDVLQLSNGSDPEISGALAGLKTRSTRLKKFCLQMTELKNRPLFYALNSRIWELREELDLLEQAAEARVANLACRSDAHLPGTYRGGMVARLQKMVIQQPDGLFFIGPTGGH